MSTILLLEIVMANLLIFAENKKLPSVDGTDGSDGMRETATGVSSVLRYPAGPYETSPAYLP